MDKNQVFFPRIKKVLCEVIRIASAIALAFFWWESVKINPFANYFVYVNIWNTP